MIATRVTTQDEIDAALAELQIAPTDEYTSDGTHRKYVNAEGKPFVLPYAEVEGFSYYSVEDILGHVRKIASTSNIVETRTYHADTKPSAKKTALKLAKKDDR